MKKPGKLFGILLSTIIIGMMSSCGTSKKPSMNNMVFRMQVKEPIEGVCDNDNILALMPLFGNNQVPAQAPKSDEEIARELNSKVTFLRDKPEYADKGMVNLIVNCKGHLVRCEIDNKTKSPELDEQVVAVFAELKKWVPGKINGNPVDSSVLYSFTIKNGKIILP